MKPSATNVQAEHGRHKNQSLPVGGWQKTAGDQHIWQLNHVPCSQNLDIDIWQTFLTKRAELCLLVWWWFVVLLRFYMISGILLRACIVHTLFLQPWMAQVFVFHTTTSLGCYEVKKILNDWSLDTMVMKPYYLPVKVSVIDWCDPAWSMKIAYF